MNRATLAATFALGLGLGVAHAQPAPAPNPAADAALAEGRRLYDLQEWDKAIAKFKEAYTLRDDAASLFNIAQSYRLKGDCTNAASFYKTFKRKFPGEKVIAKVDKFLVEMEACAKTQPVVAPVPAPVVVEKPALPPPVVTAPPPADPVLPQPKPTPAGGSHVGAYVSFGVGAVGLVVGGLGFKKAKDAEKQADKLGPGSTWDPDIQSRGNTWKWVSRGGFIVGGAGIVGGVVLLVLSGKDDESAPVALVPDANGASFVWSGSF